VYLQEAIAILDSGVGGLTVAKEVMRQLPQEQIIYFGDTSRAPYGPRSSEEVRLFTHQIVKFLLKFQPKMIVIACNTATAVALEEIRAMISIPIVGVIHPGSRAAIKKTKTNVIGVIGTEGTIRSKAYEHALKQISPKIEVISQACPRLVPLVEKGLYDTYESRAIVNESLSPLKDLPMDCLILGCTHYPFLSHVIADVMGTNVDLINSAEETAREISTVLYHRGLLAKSKAVPEHQFFCSGDPILFQRIAQQWLNEQIQVTPMVWQIPRIATML
jgi:glutamate racemase